MTCTKTPWEEAFCKDNCRKVWTKTAIIPFTLQCYWELLDTEEGKARQSEETDRLTGLNMSNFTLNGIMEGNASRFTQQQLQIVDPNGEMTAEEREAE